MNMLNRIHTVLFAGVLLATAVTAQADDLQDANKFFKQGQQTAALDKVNSYLSTKPKDAEGRFLKGLILTEQGNTNEAIKIFSDLTVDYPNYPEPYNNLAALYAGQGQFDKAKQLLETAIRTNPSYATAHENLGDIYAKMASQAYDRALQLDKGSTTTQTKLAMIQDLFSGNARPRTATNHNVTTDNVAASTVNNKTATTSAQTAAHATTASSKPVAHNTGDDNGDVLKSVHAWAAAWSAKNVNGYLAAYADDFRPVAGESRDSWAASRRERISTPKTIHVNLSDVSVKFTDNTHATAHFKQAYQASHLHTSGHKTLLLVKVDGKWLIQEERTQ